MDDDSVQAHLVMPWANGESMIDDEVFLPPRAP